MRKKIFSLLTVCLMGLTVACGSKNETETTVSEVVNQETGQEAAGEELLSGTYAVCIEVQDYGNIVVELDADSAPITVTNFMGLVNDGFYDGLTFHRIIEGFMMQGGDPTGTGMGGADHNIKGEFSDNGVNNPIKHKRGTISMARAQSADSASSQFFICQEDCDFLDGAYAAFGQVITGMEVVDAICADAKVEDNNGTVAASNQPVITSIYEITDLSK